MNSICEYGMGFSVIGSEVCAQTIMFSKGLTSTIICILPQVVDLCPKAIGPHVSCY